MERTDMPGHVVAHRVHSVPLWLWWIAGNGLGAGIGGWLAGAVNTALTPTFDPNAPLTGSVDVSNLMLLSVMQVPLSAAVIGLALALGQWLVVRQATRSADWGAGLGWIALTAGAAGVAAFLAQFLFLVLLFGAALFLGDGQGSGLVGLTPAGFAAMGVVFLVLAGALGGLLIGSAQWLILRRYNRQAGMWILANGCGWVVGMLLLMAVFAGDWMGAGTFGLVETPIAGLAAAGAAVVTGRTFTRLLAQR